MKHYFVYGHLQELSGNKLDSAPLQTALNSDFATLNQGTQPSRKELPVLKVSCEVYIAFVCDNAWNIMCAQKS